MIAGMFDTGMSAHDILENIIGGEWQDTDQIISHDSIRNEHACQTFHNQSESRKGQIYV